MEMYGLKVLAFIGGGGKFRNRTIPLLWLGTVMGADTGNRWDSGETDLWREDCLK
jgi:hypothetical protein